MKRDIRRFRRIRRFNKKSQIFFYNLKRNKLKMAFYMVCIIGGSFWISNYVSSWVPTSPKSKPSKPSIKDILISLIIYGLISYGTNLYFNSRMKVKIQKSFWSF